MGENNKIIDDFFFHMSEDFEILTTSNRNDDIISHIDLFQPDILLFCMNEDSHKAFHRIYFLKQKLENKGVFLGIIGTKDVCRDFEKAAVDIADLVLETPLQISAIRSELRVFLGKKKNVSEDTMAQKEKQTEKQAEKQTEEQESIVKDETVDKKQILIVDDDPMMLKLVNEQLHDRFNVATAISGKIALGFLKKKHADLILLDYEMPVDNGADVLRKIRENPELADIPVVFLTGVSNRETIQEVLALNVQGYLLKPIDSESLFKVIMDVLGKK